MVIFTGNMGPIYRNPLEKMYHFILPYSISIHLLIAPPIDTVKNETIHKKKRSKGHNRFSQVAITNIDQRRQ